VNLGGPCPSLSEAQYLGPLCAPLNLDYDDLLTSPFANANYLDNLPRDLAEDHHNQRPTTKKTAAKTPRQPLAPADPSVFEPDQDFGEDDYELEVDLPVEENQDSDEESGDETVLESDTENHPPDNQHDDPMAPTRRQQDMERASREKNQRDKASAIVCRQPESQSKPTRNPKRKTHTRGGTPIGGARKNQKSGRSNKKGGRKSSGSRAVSSQSGSGSDYSSGSEDEGTKVVSRVSFSGSGSPARKKPKSVPDSDVDKDRRIAELEKTTEQLTETIKSNKKKAPGDANVLRALHLITTTKIQRTVKFLVEEPILRKCTIKALEYYLQENGKSIKDMPPAEIEMWVAIYDDHLATYHNKRRQYINQQLRNAVFEVKGNTKHRIFRSTKLVEVEVEEEVEVNGKMETRTVKKTVTETPRIPTLAEFEDVLFR